jgi:uncharacterized membrane protein YkoI
MKALIPAFALAVVLTGTVYAQAQEEARGELTAAQIIQKLESLGYTDVDEVERDDGHWEAEATSANGTRVEIEIDLNDGRILREEPEND